MTSESDVLLERADGILSVTLNRPVSLNAFTVGMLNRCAAAVEASGTDPNVRVIVLTGAGRAFSSGADLGAEDGPDSSTIDAANRLTRALRAVPKPVIAAVNGVAAGVGCTLALAADLIIARESTYFLLAFANVGLMPDGGATAIVPAAVGRARASRMAMLAERVPAPQALEWGLITHTAPDGEFDAEVDRLSAHLAGGPTAAYAQTKQAFNATALPQLEQALELEREGQLAMFATADFAEGIAAFEGKRRPKFTGK